MLMYKLQWGDFYIVKETVKSRVTAVGNYIVNYSATVRKAAQKFGISKSTVHMVVI